MSNMKALIPNLDIEVDSGKCGASGESITTPLIGGIPGMPRGYAEM